MGYRKGYIFVTMCSETLLSWFSMIVLLHATVKL